MLGAVGGELYLGGWWEYGIGEKEDAGRMRLRGGREKWRVRGWWSRDGE